MMRFFLVLLILTGVAYSQDAQVVNASELLRIYKKNNDTTYVINFWATWCKPCVDELPEFLQLQKELTDKPIQFIFVSLDDAKHKDMRVIPFAEKNKMSNVFILDDNDPNEWIPKISEEWTGSIPATLITRNNNSAFYEQKINYEKLKEFIQKIRGAD